MKKFALLVFTWIASLVVTNTYAMEPAIDDTKKSSPRKGQAYWPIVNGHILNRVVLCDDVENCKSPLFTDFMNIDALIVLTESSINCTDKTQIIEFSGPEADDQISCDDVDRFCYLIKENSQRNIAVYEAGNDTKIYLMLAGLEIRGIIKDGLVNNQAITLTDEKGQIVYNLGNIRTADERIKKLAVQAIVNTVYTMLFPQYKQNTIPSCFSQEQDELIRKFCKQSLTPILGRKSSSGERIRGGERGRRNSPGPDSPRRFSPSLTEWVDGSGSPRRVDSPRNLASSRSLGSPRHSDII